MMKDTDKVSNDNIDINVHKDIPYYTSMQIIHVHRIRIYYSLMKSYTPEWYVQFMLSFFMAQ